MSTTRTKKVQPMEIEVPSAEAIGATLPWFEQEVRKAAHAHGGSHYVHTAEMILADAFDPYRGDKPEGYLAALAWVDANHPDIARSSRKEYAMVYLAGQAAATG